MQLKSIKSSLILKFGIDKDHVYVIRPEIILPDKIISNLDLSDNDFINLFYPATPFVYKNHEIIFKALSLIDFKKRKKIRIFLTCNKNDILNNMNFNGQQNNDADRVSEISSVNERDIGNESFIANETSFKIDANKNLKFKTRKNKKTDLTEYYNLIYQYKMDCLTAGIEYKKDYYNDGDLKPKESIFFSITLMPFGTSIDLPGVD